MQPICGFKNYRNVFIRKIENVLRLLIFVMFVSKALQGKTNSGTFHSYDR